MTQQTQATNMKLPKSTIAHSLDLGEVLQTKFGVSEMNEEFDKDFLLCEGMHKMIPQIISAKNKGELNSRFGYEKAGEDISLDMEVVKRMNQIWFGHVFFVIQRYPDATEKVKWRGRFYDEPPPAPGREIWRYPALRSMNPERATNEEMWGKKIREDVPISQAFERCDPQQVVLQGKFAKRYSDKVIPYFKTYEDIQKSNGVTSRVSDHYFHITIQNLITMWQDNYAMIYVDIHKIIRFLRLGNEDEDEENTLKVPSKTHSI